MSAMIRGFVKNTLVSVMIALVLSPGVSVLLIRRLALVRLIILTIWSALARLKLAPSVKFTRPAVVFVTTTLVIA